MLMLCCKLSTMLHVLLQYLLVQLVEQHISNLEYAICWAQVARVIRPTSRLNLRRNIVATQGEAICCLYYFT